MHLLIKKKFLIPLLLVLAGLYIYSIPGRSPDIDDAWIGEHAWWLAEDGSAKSVLMSGVTRQEEKIVVHHKLLTLQGALMIRLFGFSLYSLKSVSLIYFLIFLLLFYYYTVRSRKIFSDETWLLSMVLMLAYPWIFKYSFLFRPEVMVMTLSFLSFILLERALSGSGKRYFDMLLAGLVSGLAFAAHLNGAVVVAACGSLLLINKNFRGLLAFIPGVLVTSAIYMYDLSPEYGVNFWYYQFTESPSLDSIAGVPVALQPLMNLLAEHRRFFHNPRIIIFSVFMITAVAVGFRSFMKEYRNITIYTVLLFILTAMLAVHKSRQYILLYFPFLVIIMTVNLKKIFSGEFNKASARWFKNFMLVLFIIYTGGSSIYNFRLATEKFSPGDNRNISDQFLQGDPSSLKIVAPMTFIFNEIERYKAIIGEVSYTERQKTDKSIYGAGFLETAHREGIDYLVLTPYYRHKLGLDSLPDDRRYRTIYDTTGLLILGSIHQ